jgi:hypothetical protein
MHIKPLTDLFKKEKKLKNFKIFFDVPIRTHLCYIANSYARNCLWQSHPYVLRNLAQSFGAWHCGPYLENLSTLPWW